MADTLTLVYRGELATSEATLYTVPAATQLVLSSLVIANTNVASTAVTVELDGIPLLGAVALAAGGLLTLDCTQVLTAGEIISAYATTADVYLHISGVEVT